MVQGEGHEAVADLGGAVITGVFGNPLAVLSQQLELPMHVIEAEQRDCPLYQGDGKIVSSAMDNAVRFCLHPAVSSSSSIGKEVVVSHKNMRSLSLPW